MINELAEGVRPYLLYIIGGGTAAALAVVVWRMRWLGSVVRFAYPNARYNTMGNRYVSKENLTVLADSNSFQEYMFLKMTARRFYSYQSFHIFLIKFKKKFNLMLQGPILVGQSFLFLNLKL